MALEGPLLHDGSQTTSAVDASKATAGYYGINTAGLAPGAASGSGQFLFVYVSGSRAVTPAGTAGRQVYGVLQNAPKSGQAADVGIFGITKVVTGSGGVTANNIVMTDANGCAVNWSAGSAYSQLGIALETVAANAVATIYFWGSSNKVLT